MRICIVSVIVVLLKLIGSERNCLKTPTEYVELSESSSLGMPLLALKRRIAVMQLFLVFLFVNTWCTAKIARHVKSQL